MNESTMEALGSLDHLVAAHLLVNRAQNVAGCWNFRITMNNRTYWILLSLYRSIRLKYQIGHYYKCSFC